MKARREKTGERDRERAVEMAAELREHRGPFAWEVGSTVGAQMAPHLRETQLKDIKISLTILCS